MEQLRWLPQTQAWRSRLRGFAGVPDPWSEGRALANTRLDFVQTNALDATMRRYLAGSTPAAAPLGELRLALLGSSTLAHLHAALRIAGMRRNIRMVTYENEYGQYLQELLNAGSALHAFAPAAILFAFDAHHVTQGLHAATAADEADHALRETAARIGQAWRLARETFGCDVMQQTVLDVFPPLLGNNEHRLPGSRSRFVTRLNERLREMSDQHGVDLIALDDAARRDGIAAWHDPSLWHRSRQEVRPASAPSYGELVARVMAARQGRAFKCLVLDLDNTLWGGVIGDDGLAGIVLGQGSALGEGFVAVQAYAKDLARRGIILAVCSKNDPENARAPFEQHPDMVLRLADIAAFRANWDDKAANIRAIAETLNIGLDALVFLDDSPFERDLVRSALPMVAVPELPDDDPALIPSLLADAGYFESLRLTPEDHERSAQYQENRARDALKADATDIEGYLRALEMRLVWSRFDVVGLPRVVQLINKTNQFNLTTRRYNDADIEAVMADPKAFGLQFRLVDRFGDNGIIAIVIGRLEASDVVVIDTWLMSCRVLGRQVEKATLGVVAERALSLGASRLVGTYIPTAKNGMVRDHYSGLGFSRLPGPADDTWMLDLRDFVPAPGFIGIVAPA
jgi:FkbH-like protein